MRILALESSCDESAVAVLDGDAGLLAHEIFSQIDLHRLYGGVVPELASRDHVRRLLPMVRAALAVANTRPAELHAVAYTAGPGLIGALLTGAALAQSLAYGWGLPAIPVHHLEGHLLAPLLENTAPPLPHLALLVSGGHTMLVEVRALGDYVILGETRDDAAGEAFDKSAKLLGLPYPGGPQLAQLAAQGRPGQFDLPRPMLKAPGLEFSFSGLKTAVSLAARAQPLDDRRRADLARAVQDAIVDTLVVKTLRALDATGLAHLVVAGGVGANAELRARLATAVERRGGKVYYPRPAFCTDNAAMIAMAALVRLRAAPAASQAPDSHARAAALQIRARAQWPLAESRAA